MAITEDSTGSSAAPAPQKPSFSQQAHQVPNQAASAPAPAAPQQTYQGRPTVKNVNSLLSITGRIRTPLPSTPDSEVQRVLLETINEVLANDVAADYKLTFLPVNGKESDLALSVLVVVLQGKTNGAVDPSLGLSFHSLLLADTFGENRIEQQNVQGVTVNVPRVPGEAYDAALRSAVVDRLVAAFPNTNPQNFYDADSEVIPRGYNYKDAALVRETIVNATTIIASEFVKNTQTDLQDVVLDSSARNFNTQVRLLTHQQHDTNSVGEPVRSDVRLQLTENTSKYQNQGQQAVNQSLNNGGQVRDVLSVGGFFDLLWDPVPGAGVQNPYYQANPQQATQLNQLWRLRYVITDLRTSELRTIPGQLLALATLPALTEQNAFFNQFMPAKTAEFDFHDIGAIGYELAQVGNKRLNTRDNSFTETELAQILTAFTRQDGVQIALDVEESGASTYWNSVFLAAAEGSQEATETIFHAIDTLTNGNFRKIHNGQGQAVLNDQNRIHLGYYIDKAGRKRDLRDIDYLAIGNTLGENDVKAIQDFSDTYTRIDKDARLRLDARWRFIEAATGGTAVLTGFAKRITFDTENFLIPALQAIKATGYSPLVQTPFLDNAGQPRATGSYLGQGGLGSSVSGLFQRGGYNQQYASGQAAPSTLTRWR